MQLKTKYLMFVVQLKKQPMTHTKNEFKKLKTIDLSYFIGKSHFEEDVTYNYLVFQTNMDILEELPVLVMTVTFITNNIKDCLMKKLILLKRIIIALL